MSLRPYKTKPRSSRTQHRRRRVVHEEEEDDSTVDSSNNNRSTRSNLTLLLPIVFFMGVLIPSDLTSYVVGRGLRRLMHKCVKNIYAHTPKMAFYMSALMEEPSTTLKSTPTYLQMCKELVDGPPDFFTEDSHLAESDAACTDWSAPHYRLMDMFASSILDIVSDQTSYRHDCYDSRTFDEAELGMDRTTIQQMFPVSRFALDGEIKITKDELKEQCKVCLSAYDASIEKGRFKPYAQHQCLLWPQSVEGQEIEFKSEYGLGGERVTLPETATEAHVVPLSAVADQIRSRLAYVAEVASNTTDAPPKESESGVVIYIDPSSTGIAKETFPKYFPPAVTSITVLSSPLCASAILPTGQTCLTYVDELVEHFKSIESYNSALNTTGFKGSHGIKFQMAASSAGAFSRMIKSKRLVCPPNTPSCFFPAMAKKQDEESITHAFVLDDSHNTAANFFTMVGHGNRVVVERLEDIPATVEKPDVYQLLDADGAPVVQVFMDATKDYDSEGYVPGKAPEPLPTRAQIEAEAQKKQEIPRLFADKEEDLPVLKVVKEVVPSAPTKEQDDKPLTEDVASVATSPEEKEEDVSASVARRTAEQAQDQRRIIEAEKERRRAQAAAATTPVV